MTGSQAEVGGSGAQRIGASGEWLSVLRRYLAVIAVGNLAWEFAQLPLYTIWHGGTPREIAFAALHRSEEHTSELQSLMRISYAVFCLKTKKQHYIRQPKTPPHITVV